MPLGRITGNHTKTPIASARQQCYGGTNGKLYGAIDQGTTSTRFIVFDRSGRIVTTAQKEHEQIYPKPGWVELAFGASAVSPNGLAPGSAPYLWGMLVWGLGLALGGPTGYAMNPARDFGPRLAHFILPIAGKGKSDWGYPLVPIIGPLIGAALGAASIHFIKY